jgi:predicted RNA-binding Zn-ribbon protein involved in translation (DUF1610 family)
VGSADASAAATEHPMRTIEARAFDCSACGASLEFRPGVHALTCARCDNEQILPRTVDPKIRGTPLANAPRIAASTLRKWVSVHCKGCGAQLTATQRATRCPFCDSPLVLDDEALEALEPHGILPFHIDDTAARERVHSWIADHRFATTAFVSGAKVGELVGVYVPYWIFACETTTSYTGQRGNVSYEERTERAPDGTTRTRRTERVEWSPASGEVGRLFDHRLSCASRCLPACISARLEPWDLAFLQSFDPGFLSGFLCEHVSTIASTAFTELRPELDRDIATEIRLDIGGDRQRILSSSTRIYDTSYRLVLLPVWLGTLKFRGQSTPVTINARTGEVLIEFSPPRSTFKIVAVIALVVGALLFPVWLMFIAFAR